MRESEEYSLVLEKELEIKARIPQGNKDECWVYPFVNHNGYGELHTSVDGKKYKIFVHRAVLCLKLRRPIREGHLALHNCDNPPCANPSHIWEGTKEDNNKDASLKGRHRGGRHFLEKNPRSKLTREDIPEIKERLDSGESMSSIGRDFGVSYVAIRNVREKKFWSEF